MDYSVGVGGHTLLHDGYGMVSRKHGITLDLIKGATVVLNNGTIVQCSKTEKRGPLLGHSGRRLILWNRSRARVQHVCRTGENHILRPRLPVESKTAAQGFYNVQEFAKSMAAEVIMQLAVSKNGYSLNGAFVGDKAGLRKALQPLLSKLGVQISATTVGWVDLVNLLLFQFYDSVPQGQKYPSDGFSLLKGFRERVTKSMASGTWGMYSNYPDSQLTADVATELYWGKNLQRLQKIKKQNGPKNMFRSPQPIKVVKSWSCLMSRVSSINRSLG